MKHYTYISLVLVLIVSFPLHAAETKIESTDWFTLMLENDFITDDDGGYTSGLGFSWGHGPFDTFNENNIPAWINSLVKNLTIARAPGKSRSASYNITSGMFTPVDLDTKALIKDDRPYAGLLMWQGNLHAFDNSVSDKLSLMVGIVGPASGAEQLHKYVHEVTRSTDPEGWDNQIENEPVFRVAASRLWRLTRLTTDSFFEFDVIGTTLAGVGTFRSDVGVGLGFRWGHGLARSFPAASILPARDINPLAGGQQNDWYVFLNLFGRYVANDVTIEGNTFRDSHGVDLEHGQGVVVVGGAFNWKRWGFVISMAKGSDEFKKQLEDTEFGSMSVTYRK